MSKVFELINEVRKVGVTLRADPPDLVISPAGCVSPTLKARLKKHKADILRCLEREASRRRVELEASMRRLESAGICVAIWEDGRMRILVSERDAVQAIDLGGTIYSPQDMYGYVVVLSKHERRMLHDFKRRFGGDTRWKATS